LSWGAKEIACWAGMKYLKHGRIEIPMKYLVSRKEVGLCPQYSFHKISKLQLDTCAGVCPEYFTQNGSYHSPTIPNDI
jgi:hypothetical protein